MKKITTQDLKNLLDEVYPIIDKYIPDLEDIVVIMVDKDKQVHSASTCDMIKGGSIMKSLIRRIKRDILESN